MALSKMLVTLGTILVVFVYGAVGSLAPGSLIGQSAVNDVNLFIQRANGQNSCYGQGCHQGANLSRAASIHQPFQAGKCEYCHPPAAHLKQTLSSPAEQIDSCRKCHSIESLGKSHPLGEKTVDPTTGKLLTCTSCHSPHYGNKRFLLNLDERGELCLHCHTELLSKNP